jgi:hypothetical protein
MVTANKFNAETANAKKETLIHLMSKTLIKTQKDLALMLQWLILRKHQNKEFL